MKITSLFIARLLSIINVAVVIIGVKFYIPAQHIGENALNKVLESETELKNAQLLGGLVEKIIAAEYAYVVYFLICFLFLILSAFFVWKRSWLLAIVNTVIVVTVVVLYIPHYAIPGAALERMMESGDIWDVKLFTLFIKRLPAMETAYWEYFLICFVLLVISAFFLWLPSQKRLAGTKNK